MNDIAQGSAPARAETEGCPMSPQGSRRMTAIEFLRGLLRQCDAATVVNPFSKEDYASNSAYGQIGTWIRLWLTEDAEDREKTQKAKKTALAAILQDDRKQFDDADDLIGHLYKMTREPPTYMMEEAMFKAVHLFCSDWMTRQSVKTGKNLFTEKE